MTPHRLEDPLEESTSCEQRVRASETRNSKAGTHAGGVVNNVGTVRPENHVDEERIDRAGSLLASGASRLPRRRRVTSAGTPCPLRHRPRCDASRPIDIHDTGSDDHRTSRYRRGQGRARLGSCRARVRSALGERCPVAGRPCLDSGWHGGPPPRPVWRAAQRFGNAY